ncbi:MAG: hypothetical protein ACI31V_00925 [Bacilli bacterium]
MADFNSIIDKYEGKGIPYRDRSDEIRRVVSTLCKYIYSQNDRAIKEVISQYKCLKYINDIHIDGQKCTIEYDQGVVSFYVFSQEYFNHFCGDILRCDDVNGECHNVTQKVLEECHNCDISAVTSVCINTNFILYFHSYICDRKENKIIDFSKKIIMDKDVYDKLFCYKQLNDLNYTEYREEFDNSDYDGSLYPLLYLSLDKLNHKSKVKSFKIDK